MTMSGKAKNPGLSEIDEQCVNTLRFLSADGVERAKSGHPGMPMGMAAAAYVLWTRHMRFNPANPLWVNRDRFVLSAGHGSMLLYSLLYLAGYDTSLEDLQEFRQWGSRTPGHPEYDTSRGIEATTGPLGQGVSNAVGMAIAERYLASYFNRDGFKVIDHNVYSICGDGCLEEGVSAEACSLAGHLGLSNLIVIYDDNHITIDGDTELSFTEDVAKRFEAYGWHVQEVGGDGNDMEAFDKALNNAKAEKDRPSIIKLRTHIGYGSPNKQDTAGVHGAPLGEEELRLTKERFGFDPDVMFAVPEGVLEHVRGVVAERSKAESEWLAKFAEYSKKYPELSGGFSDAVAGKISVDLDLLLPEFKAGDKVATRKASQAVLNAVMPNMPMVLGGSADLTPSNNTQFKGAEDFGRDNYGGRYIRYGVREHGMGAVMNGIGLGGMVRPYGGTFFVFSDYMRASVRVAALSKYPTIFVFTHDSIGIGEDGPTHQPVEHLAAMRAIPGMVTLRPADASESVQAWKYALEHKDGPVALLFTRQKVEVIDRGKYASEKNLSRGGYVLAGSSDPELLIMATGSEVGLAIKAYEKLSADGVRVQVVSMPSWELFEKQDEVYRESVLPADVKARVAIEAGVELGWHKYIGDAGEFVGMHSFGESAPGGICMEKFGFTVDNVIVAVEKSMDKARS